MIRLYALLFFALQLPFGAYPQSNLSYYLPATVSYNPKIPTPAAAVDIAASGSGRIISIVDNPNFRAFWYGTNKLFLNSIFFGQLMRITPARAGD